MAKITMRDVVQAAKEEFGEHISDFSTFEQCHQADEFIDFDTQSGVEYIAVDHLKGYIQSWYAAELEDAGYWGDDTDEEREAYLNDVATELGQSREHGEDAAFVLGFN